MPPRVYKLKANIENLQEEMEYADPAEAIILRGLIDEKKGEIRRMLQSKEPVNPPTPPKKNINGDPVNSMEFSVLPPYKQTKIKKFTFFLKEVNIPPWKLSSITMNTKQGVSVYGYYSNDNGQRIKVRLSDHKGRWSGQDIDLRNPTDSTGISNYFKSRNG